MNYFLILLLFNVRKSYCKSGLVKTLMSGISTPHVDKNERCEKTIMVPDGSIEKARLSYPWGIFYDKRYDALYVNDNGCPDHEESLNRLRRIDIKKQTIETLAGSTHGHSVGLGKDAKFSNMAGLALDTKENKMYIIDVGFHLIKTYDITTKEVKVFAGKKREQQCYRDGSIKQACFNGPQRVVISSNRILFIADTDNNAIRVINLNAKAEYAVDTLTGGPSKQGTRDGSFQEAEWFRPTGLALDEKGEKIYVCDHYNHMIRVLDLKTQTVKTLAGNGKPGNLHQFSSEGLPMMNLPEALVFDEAHNKLYIAEFGNNWVSEYSLYDKKLTVLAGGEFGSRDHHGTDATFYHPTDIELDEDRCLLYVADQYNHRIRMVTTECSDQVASQADSIAHYLKLDGYRDLYIHNYSVFAVLFYTLFVCFVLFVYIFVKYFRLVRILKLQIRKLV